MAELDTYLELKEQVDTAQKEADEAEGAIKQIMKQIKKEFGCSTFAEAKKKYKQLKKQKEKSGKVFEDAVEEFKENWSDELD